MAINQPTRIGSQAITFGSSTGIPTKPAQGPLGPLEPENSPYTFEQLFYPISGLGEGLQYPHYITFYLNIRTKSKYKRNPLLKNENRESVLQENAGQRAGYDNFNLDVLGERIGFERKTTRTSQSIRLYMPDTMHWTYRNQWKDVSLTDALPAIFTKGAELGKSAFDAVKQGLSTGQGLTALAEDVIKKVAPSGGALLIEQIGEGINIDRDLALSTYGYAINPNIDVIYHAPELRTFIFDFIFAPRNTKEANQVLAIIQAFKFHAAPEAAPDSSAGRYFLPPTEFDIEFSVKTMGKVSTCALESVDVDYAPNGWAVYSEDQFENDMPVTIRMQLSFRELEFITKELVKKGF